MTAKVTNKDDFVKSFFEGANSLNDLNGAGLVTKTIKFVSEEPIGMTKEEFVAEAKARGWRLIKVNDQYFGYNPEKNPEFTIKQLC